MYYQVQGSALHYNWMAFSYFLTEIQNRPCHAEDQRRPTMSRKFKHRNIELLIDNAT